MTEPIRFPADDWADRLSEYLDDELAALERMALEAHLRGCTACRATLEQLRAVKARAGALKDAEPGPHVWVAIAERIGAQDIALDAPAAPGDELAERRARRRLRAPWLGAVLSAAAVLAMGIAIGRWTRETPRPIPPMVAEAPAPGTPMTADPYRVAVAQHLTRTETLLTSFRAEAASGQVDAELGAWAGQMLANTRLLLDSPAANDPKLRTLLEDLELVLAQVAALPRRTDTNHTEVDLARRAVEESRVLPRMRTLAPATLPVTQGES
jgi:predicted anti-sigma-YlaC factor YlaD